jgi:hypothetical protein
MTILTEYNCSKANDSYINELFSSIENGDEELSESPQHQRRNAAPRQRKQSFSNALLREKPSDVETSLTSGTSGPAVPSNWIDLDSMPNFQSRGDAEIEARYKVLVDTRASGTLSPNVYLNLSNTGVKSETVRRWANILSEANKIALWNLSCNESIGNEIFENINCSKTYLLNVAFTAITDAGLDILISKIKSGGLGTLKCINLTGSNVSPEKVSLLEQVVQSSCPPNSEPIEVIFYEEELPYTDESEDSGNPALPGPGMLGYLSPPQAVRSFARPDPAQAAEFATTSEPANWSDSYVPTQSYR